MRPYTQGNSWLIVVYSGRDPDTLRYLNMAFSCSHQGSPGDDDDGRHTERDDEKPSLINVAR